MSKQLIDSYIINDFGPVRDLYFYLCWLEGLHEQYEARSYKWSWIFEAGYGALQQAPERKYIAGKHRLTMDNLVDIQYK